MAINSDKTVQAYSWIIIEKETGIDYFKEIVCVFTREK